jgi:drug/metabolite transporter (DMT)-like permease
MKRFTETHWAYLSLASICLIWGTTFLGIKIGVSYMPAMMLSGLRFALAGSLICAFFVTNKSNWPHWRSLIFLCLNGLFMVGASNVLLCYSEQYISSGLASILSAMVPFWISLMGFFLLKNTQFTWRLIAGLVIGFLGIIGIFYQHLSDLMNPEYRVGILALIGSTLTWSLGTVFTTKYKVKVNMVFGAGIQMLFSGVMLIALNYLMGDTTNVAEIHWHGYLSVLYLALFGSVIGYVAYLYTISKLNAAQASIYSYINPIVAILLGWIVLDESLNTAIIGSALVTVYGVYLVNRESKKAAALKAKS